MSPSPKTCHPAVSRETGDLRQAPGSVHLYGIRPPSALAGLSRGRQREAGARVAGHGQVDVARSTVDPRPRDQTPCEASESDRRNPISDADATGTVLPDAGVRAGLCCPIGSLGSFSWSGHGRASFSGLVVPGARASVRIGWGSASRTTPSLSAPYGDPAMDVQHNAGLRWAEPHRSTRAIQNQSGPSRLNQSAQLGLPPGSNSRNSTRARLAVPLKGLALLCPDLVPAARLIRVGSGRPLDTADSGGQPGW